MASVRWTQSPRGIAQAISLRSAAVQEGVGALAHSHAARGEATMKSGAPWNDRTGNARQGLFGQAETSVTGATIQLGGTVEYQGFLELGTSRMSPRPIIVPTAETVAVEFTKDAIELVRKVFG